jgi:hypothetical protein
MSTIILRVFTDEEIVLGELNISQGHPACEER